MSMKKAESKADFVGFDLRLWLFVGGESVDMWGDMAY